MSETQTTQTTAAPAAPPAEAKPTRVKNNGVTRPEGAKTGRVWAIADEISAAKKAPAERKEVMEKARAEGINPATVATQYGRWRKFFGLKKEARQPKAEAAPAEKAAAPAASDISVQPK